jgi:hypothetical protein
MSKTQTDQTDLAGELAYVRALAEEGRDAPLLGGAYYLLWGGLMGAAALVAFLGLVGVISLGRGGAFVPWAAAGVIGWVVSMLFSRRHGKKPGTFTLGNRTAAATWLAVGIFMTVFWVALIFVHDDFTALGVPRYFLFYLMFPVAFGVYGVAFYATAVAARANWLKIFALLSWAFSIGALFLAGSVYQFLAGSLGCFVCAALPGLLLMRGEPQEIV